MASPSVRYLSSRNRFALATAAGPTLYLSRDELLRIQADARVALRAHAEEVILGSREVRPLRAP